MYSPLLQVYIYSYRINHPGHWNFKYILIGLLPSEYVSEGSSCIFNILVANMLLMGVLENVCGCAVFLD